METRPANPPHPFSCVPAQTMAPMITANPLQVRTENLPVTAAGRPLGSAGGPTGTSPAAGAERRHGGERWIGIDHVDAMAPFLTTAVGDNDCWLFAGSNGVLCAGRRDCDHALFPYLNADRLLEHPGAAGFLTAILIDEGAGRRLWEPWAAGPILHPRSRGLFRHESGAGLLYEELDHDSGLTLSAEIATCTAFGLVRRVTLTNHGHATARLRILDGWHHLLPDGLGMEGWRDLSYLALGYMRHERRMGSPLALYTLNAAISDRAEPQEMTRVAAAWALGPGLPTLLSTRQLDDFRRGGTLQVEHEARGITGALLTEMHADLEPGEAIDWMLGADTGLDHAAAIRLSDRINHASAVDMVAEALAADRHAMRQRLAAADAVSATGVPVMDDHHSANVLFNIMRGGALPAAGLIEREAFAGWLLKHNCEVAARHRSTIAEWPAAIAFNELARLAEASGDVHLERLARAYLPLSFSRRHGDPSRPWNRFSIRLHDREGRPVNAWQGNWRDIFQNWEALALSFPTALPAMIANFLDATTADGYNPYRVSSDGIDWEIPAHGPFSHFGYWGDHQIVYLTRLLDLCERHLPGHLTARLGQRSHACADVPYRIADFEALVHDPRHGVSFDHSAHDLAKARVARLGADGRLLPGPDGAPLLLSLAEKLLIPVLAKLSNFVPGGGIWLNTQRPEWNDANNALVGWGLSIVTVCQLRAHLVLLGKLFENAGPFPCSTATAELIATCTNALHAAGTPACSDPRLRCWTLERLGHGGERHRKAVYARELGDIALVPSSMVAELIAAVLPVIDETIAVNRRDDGTWHSYNILQLETRNAHVHHLDLMLEGQVAVLASGVLDPANSVALLRSLRASPLWDPARHTYLLYPDREQVPFLERNRVAETAAHAGALVPALLARGDTRLVLRDDHGILRFSPDLGNARELAERLAELAEDPEFSGAVARDHERMRELWEDTFHHRGYLGRSGTMFAFEGLGSVYWHMVSKLLLAVVDRHRAAVAAGAPREIVEHLARSWEDIRSGLGPARTPAEFGAFPWDPYSHTPAHAGAQQPGMTGQVKEGIIVRRGELGVEVSGGCLRFAPRLITRDDLRRAGGPFTWYDIHGTAHTLGLPAETLVFTVCQIPVIYDARVSDGCTVVAKDGSLIDLPGRELDQALSAEVFRRSGEIARIEVGIGALMT